MVSTLEFNTPNEDLDLIAHVSNTEVQLSDQFDTFHSEQLKNMYMAAGYILNASDLAKLKREKRPIFQKNLFKPVLKNLVGNFKSNLPGIEFLGVTEDDHKIADILQKTNDWILYSVNDFLYELSKSYLFAAISRISWLKQEFTYRNDPFGNVEIEFYDKFLKFDTERFRRDLKYTKFISDSSWLSPEEIIRIYAKNNPGLADEITEKAQVILGESVINGKNKLTSWLERLANVTIEYTGDEKGFDATKLQYDKYGDWHNSSNQRFKVIDFYERVQEKQVLLLDRTSQQTYDVTKIAKDRNRMAYFQAQFIDPYIEENYKEVIFQRSVCPGLNVKLYNKPQRLQNGNFKFTPIVFDDFHLDPLETRSIIDDVKSSVQAYNLHASTILTQEMRAAHGGWIAEEGALKELAEQFVENQIGGVKKVKDGALRNKMIREISFNSGNPNAFQLQEQNRNEVDHISGINDNAKGNEQSSSESGKLYAQRVQQAELMQEGASENAQSAAIMVSRNNLWYMQNMFTTERIVRITGEFGEPQWLTINQRALGAIQNDVTVGKFDVRVSKSPFGKNAREIEKQKSFEIAEFLATINPELVNVRELILQSDMPNKDAWIQWVDMVQGVQQQQLLQEQVGQQLQQEQMIQSIMQQQLGNQGAQLQNQGTQLQNEATIMQNESAQTDLQIEQQVKEILGIAV